MSLSIVLAEDAFIVREGVRMLREGAGYELRAAVENYDELWALSAKSGVINFADWTHHQEAEGTPWHDFDHSVLMSDVESQVERNLSGPLMSSNPDLIKVEEGSKLIEQGQPGETIYLVLDGMLRVDVDGEEVAELGPGAIVGERAVLEGGFATSTVTAITPVRVAGIAAETVDPSELEEVATGHHREDL